MNKYILLSIFALFVGNIVVWFQVNGQLIWKSFQGNSLALCLAGAPIAYLFIKATQWGYQGFDEKLWPLRVVSFIIGMSVFALMTAVYLNELPDPKTMIALILCILALVIQVCL